MSNIIAVIGGGASGMMAAICAARKGASVTIYEKNSRLGKKILSTGNGRCNITNALAAKSNYHGTDIDFMDNIINKFWVKETTAFFEDIGLLLKIEDKGKMYPYSNQASAVLDVLRFEIERLAIPVVYEFEAEKVIHLENGYKIKSYNGKEAYADKVIIACGGKAAPDTGSNGSGYALCKMLGHSVTCLSPSLVQIKTENTKSLKGIKTDAVISIGEIKESGELLFTDYGISGPPVFSISSRLSENNPEYVVVDFMPEYTQQEIFGMLKKRCFGHINLENYFVGMLNKRIGMAVLKKCSIEPLSRMSDTLKDNELSVLSQTIKSFKLKIEGTMSWNNAQVTSGGVKTEGIDSETFESIYNKGVYFCGEIIDIDGDCGGFNLQWAWSSGYVAGINAALT